MSGIFGTLNDKNLNLSNPKLDAAALLNEAVKILRTSDGRKRAILLGVRKSLTKEPEHLAIVRALKKSGRDKVGRTPKNPIVASYYNFALKHVAITKDPYRAISHLTREMITKNKMYELFEGNGEFGLAAAVELKLNGNTRLSETLRDLESLRAGPLLYIAVIRF